jgi:hypothetical protein
MSILALTTNTLTSPAAAGNIEYNGQFFGTDSNAARAQMQRITQGTAVASTSGTSIDFTGLPAWVKKITVMFSGVSLSATAVPLIQIGAGSIASTGYLSASTYLNGTAGATITSTAGYTINNAATAAYIITGSVTLSLLNSSTGLWVASGALVFDTVAYSIVMAGSKTLSGTLDRVRITTSSTDTFDAGSVNILYEG